LQDDELLGGLPDGDGHEDEAGGEV